MNSATFEWKPSFEPLAFARQSSTRTAQKPLLLAEILQAIGQAARRPLARATTLPAQAYTSEEFFEWEMQPSPSRRLAMPGPCFANTGAGRFFEPGFAGRTAHRRTRQRQIRSRPVPRLPPSLDGHHAGWFRLRGPYTGRNTRWQAGLRTHSPVPLSLSCVDV